MRTYFGSQRGAALPGRLQLWLRGQPAGELPAPRDPLVVEREDASLIVRAVSRGEGTVLLLTEQSHAPRPDDLRSLDVTSRQAEILCWVAQGKTNGEIAVILGMNARNVEKHLERSYQRLGVETRTAAAAAVWSALSARQR